MSGHGLRGALPAAAIMAIALVAGACATSGASGSAAVARSPVPASPGPSASAQASSEPRTAGLVLGAGTYPTFSVELPAIGWSNGDGHFMVRTGGPVMGLSVWDVGQVPSDPCHWRSTQADSGRSVDDLVAALVGQKSRRATQPTAVTLAGSMGRYLEWSVPTDAVVTGDADFAGCDLQDNGHRDFVSWMGNGYGERYQQVAGQIDRLWVLDVNGQRLLVDATYGPDATQAARDELSHVATSLRFVQP